MGTSGLLKITMLSIAPFISSSDHNLIVPLEFSTTAFLNLGKFLFFDTLMLEFLRFVVKKSFQMRARPDLKFVFPTETRTMKNRKMFSQQEEQEQRKVS